MCNYKFFVLFLALSHVLAFAHGPSGPSAWLPIPSLTPLALNAPLVPLARLAPLLPVPVPQQSMHTSVVVEESDDFSRMARQHIRRFSEIVSRFFDGENRLISESEELECEKITDFFEENGQQNWNICVEFMLIHLKSSFFSGIEWNGSDIDTYFHFLTLAIMIESGSSNDIETVTLDEKNYIEYLASSLKELKVNRNSAQALSILLFALSATPNDKIANFKKVISEVVEILPNYISVKAPLDLRYLICLGYCFLQFTHKNALPDNSIGQMVHDIVITELIEPGDEPNPFVKVLIDILGAKFFKNRDSQIAHDMYDTFVAERKKFQNNKFINIHIQRILIEMILNKNSSLNLSKEELIRCTSDIFSGYKLNKHDISEIIAIIKDVIDREQNKLFCHVEHAQYLLNFLEKQIRSLPREQQISLIQDLGRLSITLLITLVPEKYTAEDFTDLHTNVQILKDSGLSAELILSFFPCPDHIVLISVLSNMFDKELLEIQEGRQEVSVSEMRRLRISRALLYLGISYYAPTPHGE